MRAWIGWIAAFFKVDDGSEFGTEIFATGGRFLLTGPCCKYQTWPNGTQYWPGKTSGCFRAANGLEKGKLHVCTGSNYRVHY